MMKLNSKTTRGLPKNIKNKALKSQGSRFHKVLYGLGEHKEFRRRKNGRLPFYVLGWLAVNGQISVLEPFIKNIYMAGLLISDAELSR